MKIILFINNLKKRARFPIIGIPNKENVNVLIVLFKVRCAEIGGIYSIILHYKRGTKNGNWVRGFLEQYYGWDYGLENEKDITDLLSDKFCFTSDKYYLTNEEIAKKKSNLKDLMLAVKLNHGNHINVLSAMRTYGTANNTIEALIQEYEKFQLNPATLFVHNKPLFNWLKHKTVNADDKIEQIWTEIFSGLRAALLALDVHDQINLKADQLIKEINTLSHMQRSAVIEQYMENQAKPLEDNNPIWLSYNTVSDEEVQSIIANLRNNPIKKFFNR